jgi:hypothetical protein
VSQRGELLEHLHVVHPRPALVIAAATALGVTTTASTTPMHTL